MKRVFIILLLVLLTTCSFNKTIKIGFISTLTGRMSSLGVETRNSVELAIQQINQNGGIRGRILEIVITDDGNDIEKSIKVTEKLLESNIKFIISAQTSSYAESLLDITKDKNILTISPTMSTTYLSNKNDNFIRICPTNKSQSDTLVSILKNHNRKSVAIIYDMKNKTYSRGLFDYINADYVNSSNNSITDLPFTELSETCIENILNKIENCDSILFIASSTDVALICQQLKKRGIKIPLYSGTWAMTENLIKMGGESVEGLYIVHETLREPESQEYIQYREEYLNKYGDYPSFISTRAYEAIRLLIWAMEKSKSFNPKKVKKEIITTAYINGVIQDYTMNIYGDVEIDHTLFQIQNNQFIISN